jgi:thiamine biosynthesis lipoprotein ApbE
MAKRVWAIGIEAKSSDSGLKRSSHCLFQLPAEAMATSGSNEQVFGEK